MLKRVFFGLFAAMFLCGGAAAATDQAAIRAEVRSAVSAYAAAVDQPNAADEAFEDFLIQGFFVNSGRMPITEKDPIVAAVFNALLTQESLLEGISRGISWMEQLHTDTLFLSGGTSWHDFYYDYTYYGYLSDHADPERYIGHLINAKSVHGGSNYAGPRNRNDDVMELLAGTLTMDVLIRRTEETADRAVYTLEIHFYDNFDFNSGYDAVAEKGFNTTKDVRLRNLGLLLKLFGLSDFYWEFSTPALTVDIPSDNDFSVGSHRWVYDSDTQEMANITADGFVENPAASHPYVVEGVTRSCYYTLENSILLQHDKPWVVSFDTKIARNIHLSALSSHFFLPSLYFYSRSNVWAYSYQYFPSGEIGSADGTSVYHFTGVETGTSFSNVPSRTYTYELENVPAADGSNMIYLSIFDHTLHQRVYGPAPLDSYWRDHSDESSGRVLLDAASTRVSGQDFLINSIGSKSIPIAAPTTEAVTLDLRIHTEGTDERLDWPDAPMTISGAVTEPAGVSVTMHSGSDVAAVKVSSAGTFSAQTEHPVIDVVVSAPGCLTTTFKNVSTEGSVVAFGKITPVRGDVNGDEMINIMDMAAFRQNFGLVGETILNALTDINADGMVNIMDMAAFRQNFGMTAARDCTTVYPL